MAGPETHTYSVGNIKKIHGAKPPSTGSLLLLVSLPLFLSKLLERGCISIIRFYFSLFNVFNFFPGLAPAFISRGFKDRITRPRRRPVITFTSLCASLAIPDSCAPAAVCVWDTEVSPVLKNLCFSAGQYTDFHELNY